MLRGEVSLEPVALDSPEGLTILRHSAAHVMACAVQRLFPTTKVTIGPAIDKGFYYDFDADRPFSVEDFPAIVAEMRHIVKEAPAFLRREVSKEEAVRFFEEKEETYKVEIVRSIEADRVSLYELAEFTDLCRGPHVPDAGLIKAFSLLSVAGAYWRGDEKNKMLSRIYGVAFPGEAELKTHLHRLEGPRAATTENSAANSTFSTFMRMSLPAWSSGIPRVCLCAPYLKTFCERSI